MFGIVLFAVVGIVAIFVPYLIWDFLVGGMLLTAIKRLFKIVNAEDTTIDAGAPIVPSTRQPISDFMEELAESAKGKTSVAESQSSQIPRASIAATTSDVKTNYEPPYRANPDIIEANNNNMIESPMQPFVEDHSVNRDGSLDSKRTKRDSSVLHPKNLL